MYNCEIKLSTVLIPTVYINLQYYRYMKKRENIKINSKVHEFL